jgi:autotransporter-associated beta strand protein
MCPQITVDACLTTVNPRTDMKYATNVVVWTGAQAETFETPVAFWGDGAPRRFALRNEGSAALTAGMEVSVDGESGNISLLLDGATAPVIYGATLGTAIPVAVAGDVTLPDGVDLTNVSGFMLEGGRLRCENASAFTPPPVSVVSGENAITVGGADVTVDITRTSGTLDILREDDATVVCAGLAGQSPAWLTVNGQPATVNGEGRILTVPPAHDVAIAARGDVVPDGSTQVVGITTDGTGGNDTLAADTTAVKGLVQKTAADATVAVGAGQTLSAGTLAIADGAGALTVGDVSGQGTLAAAEGGIDVRNQSLTKALTVNAKIANANGSWIDVTGNGNVFAGGTAEPMKLKVHNGTLKLTGSGTFDLAELMVATNLADKTSTLILENAADVTYSAVDKFTAAVGGTKDVSAASTISKLVISNSTLRCDMPGYMENYDSNGYTTNTFIVGYNGGGIMEVLEGGTFKGRLIVGGPGNDSSRYGSGAVYQRDGRVELYGMSWNHYQGSSYLGGYLSNAGYYELTGGELLTRGLFILGINSTVGVFQQYGGLFCSSNCITEAGGTGGSANLVLGASNGAMGQMFVRNCKCDITGNLIFNQAFNSSVQSHMTASGEDAFIDNHDKTVLANGNLWNQYVASANVNLIDGGRMRVGSFRQDSSYSANFTDPSNHFFHVWFDGGILETGNANKDLASSRSVDSELYKYGISSFLVGPNGATVDTAGKTGNYSRKPFAAPTNGMVTAVSGFVPFKSPMIASRKMVGAPGIRIDGDGKGACAVAQFDSRSQMVTNVIITSGGTGYTWAKAVFFYWVGSYGTYQTLDCTVSAPVSGSFTKDGAGDFTFRAANTYGGETVLKGGVLRLGAEGALPEGTVVAYEGGALEAGAETFPAELKVRIPGAEDDTARSCTLVTFTNSLPASLPAVEVVNAPAAKRPCWVAMFKGMTLRAVRQRGVVVSVR